MMRKLAAMLIMVTTTALALGACGDGLSTEDATERCNEERTKLPQCIGDAEMNACVSCFEECGEACGVISTVCPATFSCAVQP